MRTLPGMRVLSGRLRLRQGGDPPRGQDPGPFYVRMGREPLPEVYEEGLEVEEGFARVLREGADVSIMACGVEVAHALTAASSSPRRASPPRSSMS